jgi:hypothetical protein
VRVRDDCMDESKGGLSVWVSGERIVRVREG